MPKGALLVGVFFLLIGAGPLGCRLRSKLAPASVVGCEVTHAHSAEALVSLSDGTRVLLDSSDIKNPARCLYWGVVVEKRRGELGYRIDGRVQPWDPTAGIILMCVGVAVMIVGGLMSFLLRHEQRRRFRPTLSRAVAEEK